MMSATTGALTDLTVPRTTDTAKAVVNAYLRGALGAFLSLPVSGLRAETQGLHARTIDLAQRTANAPRPLVAILRRPTHGALIWTTLRAIHSGDLAKADALLFELCLLTQLELARLGAKTSDTPIARPLSGWPRIVSVEARTAIELSAEVETIGFRPRELVVQGPDRTWMLPLRPDTTAPEGFPGRVSQPYHPIVEGIYLALTDNNPLSMDEAHPDKSGNAIDLGGHGLDEWLATLRAAFALVDRYLPVTAEEMRLVLKVIVPVGYHDQRHLSASYQEAVGTIYMTLHPNLMTMTEALIHEFQHNKINAAFHLDPMLENAFSPLYKSPVRPDPRPLHGVILAVHAFQPVAKLYENMTAASDPLSQNPAFQKRFRDIIRMNRAGSQTVLEHARPTPVGAALFDEMRTLEKEQFAYETAHWTEPAAGPAQALPE
jgi:HEXXH motif-containing protein